MEHGRFDPVIQSRCTVQLNQETKEQTKMATLSEGIFPCVVLGATYDADADSGVPTVRINIKFTEGPNAGRLATYEDEVSAKSAKYVGWSCKSVGWTMTKLDTLGADCAAWIEKTGGKTDAEIKHIEIKRGKKYDKWIANGSIPSEKPVWDKCAGIGRGPKPLVKVTARADADANEAMRAAMSDSSGDTEESPF